MVGRDREQGHLHLADLPLPRLDREREAGDRLGGDLARLVRTQLYGVTPADPWTMVLATIGLIAVACAAGYVPALRASRIDPIRALRYE